MLKPPFCDDGDQREMEHPWMETSEGPAPEWSETSCRLGLASLEPVSQRTLCSFAFGDPRAPAAD